MLIRTLDNHGSIQFDAGRFVLQNGIFNNLGQMTIAHDPDIASAGGANQFNNSGTLTKAGSGNTSFSSVAFNNGGILNWPAGNLLLGGGGENTQTITVPAGGFLQFSQNWRR